MVRPSADNVAMTGKLPRRKRNGRSGGHITPLNGRTKKGEPCAEALATRNVTRDDCGMRFSHKGLRALAEHDQAARLPSELVDRLRRILTVLDGAQRPGDVSTRPGYRLHPLHGGRAGQWSISVSGNWRVVFRFEDSEAVDVDLVDYH